MKSELTDPIAAARFVLVRADGTDTLITAMVGRPYVVNDHEARCPAKLDGVDPQYSDICGEDTLHALCLALLLLRRRLEGLLEQGHVLLDPEEREPVDIAQLRTTFGVSRLSDAG
jgi:hypothetical protein